MKLNNFLTPSDKALLAKTRDIATELPFPGSEALLEQVFATGGEPLSEDDVALLTEALNVARCYALANDATREAIWQIATASRKRVRREIRRRTKIRRASFRERQLGEEQGV